MSRSSPPPTRRAAAVDDDDAFQAYVRAEARRRIEHITLASAISFAATWGIGRLTLPEVSLQAPGNRLLALMAAFALGAFVVFRYAPLAGRYPVPLAAAAQTLLCALAAAPVMGEIHGPFVYAIYLLPPLAIGLPMGIAWRVVVTAVGPSAFALVYLLTREADSPLLVAMMVGTATSVVSVILGHRVHVVGRERFMLERALARRRDELERDVEHHTERLDSLRRTLERAGVDRADVARALHDDLGQLVVRVRMELNLLERTLRQIAPLEDGPPLEHLTGVVETLDQSVRVFIDRLRSPERVHDLEGSLEVLVEPLRRRAGLHVETEIENADALTDDAREVVYRLAQEALTNVFKHARAGRVLVRVDASDERVVATVRDDGRGFDRAAVDPARLGLRGLRDRARAVGGSLSVESAAGEGTTLRLELPGARSRSPTSQNATLHTPDA